MNSYLSVRSWFHSLSAKSYAGILIAVLSVIAAVVFGVVPNQNLLVVNAFLSGTVWCACLLVIVLGGRRVDAASFAAASLISAGLTMSIPSIFYEHTPVDWGSTVSRLGFAILTLRWGYDLITRIKDEAEAKK